MGAALFTGSPASAQSDQLDRLNVPYVDVPPARRSDLILLPALAEMDPPPVGADTPAAAQLLYTASTLWPAAEAWVTAEPQRKVIEALGQATRGVAEGRPMHFAQPYGPQGVDPALIKARLYTALGDPPLLAGKRLLYLRAINDLVCLVNVEATRLGDEGKPGQACDLLVNLVYLGRQLADRSFFEEATAGLSIMKDALTRIRDVAYVDFRGSRNLSPADIERTIKALEIYGRGYLDPARLKFPEGHHLAARQLFEQLYEPRGHVREDMYAKTMARLKTAERPLRLFAEASRYESAGAEQADWFEMRDTIENVFGSWSSRWTLSPFDRQLALPYTWDLTDQSRFQVITASSPDLAPLYQYRLEFETEAVGTRHALALLGYFYELGVFPPDASSVRPRWMEKIEADPFNPDRRVGRVPPMHFFVPVRDDYVADERDTAQPHEMNVFPLAGVNFALRLREDQFVLYSVGRNGVDDNAAEVTDDASAAQTGDYLIWPPVLSLYRTHLIQTNQLP
ncbi:MAG: hypothetical protein DYG94_13965 [Leptolyngbya sp. PLA3]|nr:MAG: hypothetical protein EDM82_14520 [Cyanobacteria bacterium CYA]MCE7969834.1 hypothetical protein [Leptolyngbya sp. PL-A3]